MRPEMATTDEQFMRRALELAALGSGLVSPNPMVGSVLVKDGEIVGEGYHRFDLLKHAEVVALEAAGPAARGATLFCSLEPCCHYGRTPPCTDAIIAAGVERVVVPIIDPDPRVMGQGVDSLRRAEIPVDLGLCAAEASELNEVYLKFTRTGLPFVHTLVVATESGLYDGLAESSQSLLLNALVRRYDAFICRDLSQRTEWQRMVVPPDRHRPLIIGTVDGLRAASQTWYGSAAVSMPELALHNSESLLQHCAAEKLTGLLLCESDQSGTLRESIGISDCLTVVASASQTMESIEAKLRETYGIRFRRRQASVGGGWLVLTGSVGV